MLKEDIGLFVLAGSTGITSTSFSGGWTMATVVWLAPSGLPLPQVGFGDQFVICNCLLAIF